MTKYRLGREVKVRRRPGGADAVFAFRMPREMLVALDEQAVRREVPLSEVIRDAVSAWLHPAPTTTRSVSTAQTLTVEASDFLPSSPIA